MKSALLSLFLLLILFQVKAQDFRNQSKRANKGKDTAQTQVPVYKIIGGVVRSGKTKEVLPLANIFQAGTTNAAQSDEQGNYILRIDLAKAPVLVCTYFGFVSDTVKVNPETGIVNFELKERFFSINDIVVSVSRKNERRFESPVTIEALSVREIQQNPSMNLYERLVNLATVDAITTSVNFKTLNTRGFNSTYNRRFIQRFDNMDLSMPGFNLSLGQLNGPIDLDVERTELIPGANSALYGPNAICGLLNTVSRNPFTYPGISAEIRGGANHLDGKDISPQPLYDVNLRLAKIFSEQWAGKITMGYLSGADWRATDYRDISSYDFSNNLTTYGFSPGPGNPGYNGLNIGGDEVSAILDTSIKNPVTNKPLLTKGPLRVSRTGYREDQLFQYKPYAMKADMGVFFRPKKGTEISFVSRFGLGSSNFQTDNRTQVSNYFLQQHKVEMRTRHFTFRSYVSMENIGEAIDISLTSVNINRTAKPDENWFSQYVFAFSGQYNEFAKALAGTLDLDTLRPGNDEDARRFADGDNSFLFEYINSVDTTLGKLILGKARYEPNTYRMDSVQDLIRNRSFKDNGGRIISTSKTWYTEAVWDLSSRLRGFDLLTGVNYRLYAPQSSGSVFQDSAEAIYYSEAGAFVQAGKSLLNDRLKLQGSGRVDVFQLFSPRFSPRVSALFLLGSKRQHSLRASAQIGYRMPAIIDIYSHMDVRGALTFGGLLRDSEKLGIVKYNADGSPLVNLFTQNSVTQYQFTGDPNVLVRPVIKDIAPEELRTLEAGWRSFLFEKLETDFNIYLSEFTNLINAQQFIGPINRQDTITAAYLSDPSKTQVYRRFVNMEKPLSSWGASFTANYYLNKSLNLYGNYNFNQLLTNTGLTPIDFAFGFNTPRNKVNLGFLAFRFYNNISVSCNLRWVDQFYFMEYDRVGTVPTYYTLDMMVSYALLKQKMLLKLGGTNITNNRYTQALGSPTVGALVYFSIMYDGLLK